MAVIEYRGALFTVREDESALEALIRGGADIRFSCRKGSCQTCMMRAVEGTPTERAQRGLRPSSRRRAILCRVLSAMAAI